MLSPRNGSTTTSAASAGAPYSVIAGAGVEKGSHRSPRSPARVCQRKDVVYVFTSDAQRHVVYSLMLPTQRQLTHARLVFW